MWKAFDYWYSIHVSIREKDSYCSNDWFKSLIFSALWLNVRDRCAIEYQSSFLLLFLLKVQRQREKVFFFFSDSGWRLQISGRNKHDQHRRWNWIFSLKKWCRNKCKRMERGKGERETGGSSWIYQVKARAVFMAIDFLERKIFRVCRAEWK